MVEWQHASSEARSQDSLCGFHYWNPVSIMWISPGFAEGWDSHGPVTSITPASSLSILEAEPLSWPEADSSYMSEPSWKQNHPLDPNSNCLSTEWWTKLIMFFFFKPASLGVVCYAAIASWYNFQMENSVSQLLSPQLNLQTEGTFSRTLPLTKKASMHCLDGLLPAFVWPYNFLYYC